MSVGQVSPLSAISLTEPSQTPLANSGVVELMRIDMVDVVAEPRISVKLTSMVKPPRVLEKLPEKLHVNK
jgi:hypothetical protein